jgi:hypothetical protein
VTSSTGIASGFCFLARAIYFLSKEARMQHQEDCIRAVGPQQGSSMG